MGAVYQADCRMTMLMHKHIRRYDDYSAEAKVGGQSEFFTTKKCLAKIYDVIQELPHKQIWFGFVAYLKQTPYSRK